MGMFGKAEEINLFETTSSEQEFYIKSNKTTVRIDENFIRVARGGAANAILQGLDGEKTILLKSLTAFQVKEPGMTVGYLQLVYPGSADTKGGIYKAVSDENTITFVKSEKDIILQIKSAIESKMIIK